MQVILSYAVAIFVTLETIFSLTPNIFGTVTTYSPEEVDVILNCAVVSDTHADADTFRDRTNILRKAYAGIAECSEDIDVCLHIGDITNSGSEKDYRNQKRLEKVYLKAKNYVACLGNHDSWNGSADPNYEQAKAYFFDYLKTHNIESENVYYSTVINGYYFICLGTESLDLHENRPTYSEKQLEWFDNELTKAEKSLLPVFVLCHRPAEGHNGFTGTGLPTAVNTILQSHSDYNKPILFFSGHCHSFTPKIFEKDNNIYYINMPSTEYNDDTEYECNDKGGMGLAMEVYSDKIILKARNYITDKWVDGYRFEIEL